MLFRSQLTHNEIPEIKIDGELELIYINELVEEFYQAIQGTLKIKSTNNINYYTVPHTSINKVSGILKILTRFKSEYFEKGIIPKLENNFELSLFNTFRCYFVNNKFPFPLIKHSDNRGSFTEVIRTNISGQFSFSTTKPGVTRGNHFHTRKIERFTIIKGKAKIQIRRIGTNEVIEYLLDGNEPSFVDMPVWCTHNITNIGKQDLITLFWSNEIFNPEKPDTYYEKVRK